MKPEINNYIVKHYYQLLEISNRMTKNDSFAGDLLNDVLLQLYEKQDIKLRSYDDNSIKYYIIGIMKINWFSKTSPFFYKVKRESLLYNELSVNLEIHDSDSDFNKHEFLQIMEECWADLDWFRKVVFERYMLLGSLKKVSKTTSIPLTSIARYVNTAKADIKHNVFKKMN